MFPRVGRRVVLQSSKKGLEDSAVKRKTSPSRCALEAQKRRSREATQLFFQILEGDTTLGVKARPRLLLIGFRV